MLGLTPGDAPTATWTFECQLSGAADPDGIAPDIKGPYIQGPPGGRFIYLNWVTIDDAGPARLFRRAKLWLDGVPPAVLGEAARTGLLVGRLGLTDPKGNPTCSAGRPGLEPRRSCHRERDGPTSPRTRRGTARLAAALLCSRCQKLPTLPNRATLISARSVS